MQVEYGGYLAQFGATNWTVSRQTSFTVTGAPFLTRHAWDIQGYVRGDTIPELTARMQELEAAFSVHGQTIRILNNGQETAHKLENSSTIDGTRVEYFGFQRGRVPATEYINRRSWAARVTGTTIAAADGYLSYQESLRVIGTGGPVVIWKPALVGPPQAQIVQTQSSVIALQRGSAVGISSYPQYPAYLFDGGFLKSKQSWQEIGTPRQLGNTKIGFPISWFYVFEGLQFSGTPVPPV